MSKYSENVGYIDELHQSYLAEPSSVSEIWREFFKDYRPDGVPVEPQPTPAPTPAPATPAPATTRTVDPIEIEARKAAEAGDDATALGLWQKLARHGHAQALFQVGRAHYFGKGTRVESTFDVRCETSLCGSFEDRLAGQRDPPPFVLGGELRWLYPGRPNPD